MSCDRSGQLDGAQRRQSSWRCWMKVAKAAPMAIFLGRAFGQRLVWVLGTMLILPGCEREKRNVRESPPAAQLRTITMGELRPGHTQLPIATENPYEKNAVAVSEGRRLYNWFNCNGCHFNGGGGIGPPLMDDEWIYGSDPANVFATIIEGRPNGMPSYRGRMPDHQVWQIVAYVRSLSGQVRSDVAPGRADSMQSGSSPQSAPRQEPKATGAPATD